MSSSKYVICRCIITDDCEYKVISVLKKRIPVEEVDKTLDTFNQTEKDRDTYLWMKKPANLYDELKEEAINNMLEFNQV